MAGFKEDRSSHWSRNFRTGQRMAVSRLKPRRRSKPLGNAACSERNSVLACEIYEELRVEGGAGGQR